MGKGEWLSMQDAVVERWNRGNENEKKGGGNGNGVERREQDICTK